MTPEELKAIEALLCAEALEREQRDELKAENERLREALKDIADGRLDDIPASQAGFVTSLQRVAREALKEGE